jgi:hypothetical protein
MKSFEELYNEYGKLIKTADLNNPNEELVEAMLKELPADFPENQKRRAAVLAAAEVISLDLVNQAFGGMASYTDAQDIPDEEAISVEVTLGERK